ncbi:hypothetical protein MSAN_01758000 [Mycena sanguinolenta]|uniref:Uncharacterized protein n=1 Tax=Mycena sanguinolenta TaxID=230812 RepID=A0A8H7CU27_9AGAR|nr:hypothetical protein MSAN_01758000 [Mycena sanguinolenta]
MLRLHRSPLPRREEELLAQCPGLHRALHRVPRRSICYRLHSAAAKHAHPPPNIDFRMFLSGLSVQFGRPVFQRLSAAHEAELLGASSIPLGSFASSFNLWQAAHLASGTWIRLPAE